MIDTARKLRSKHVEKVLGALLLLTGLAVMSGCQGLSAGGTGIQNPGTLGSNLSSISFGDVTVGKTQTISGTVTNKGSSSITLSQASISGAGYTLTGISANGNLAAGQSANFSVKFAPTSSGTSNGTLTVTSNASNGTLTIPVSGTGTAAVGTLGASPSSLNFGSVTVGQNQTLSSTITNTGSASVSISQVGITGSGFTVSGITTPLTLTAGATATVSVKFAPTSSGSASGTVTVTSDASNTSLTIGVSGTGATAAGQLSISPSTLAFGSVADGTSSVATATLKASGANVTVTAASTNNSVFTIGGLSLPVTIAAGASLPVTVTFSPQTASSFTGTLSVTSNASPSTSTETLTGTGTSVTSSHTVNLSWNASSSSNISGYNIYRAVYTTQCGSYSKINQVINTTTLYTDSTVANSTSYCYAATAVNTSSQESGYSNIVSNVQIP
jgi:hypothetical protein